MSTIRKQLQIQKRIESGRVETLDDPVVFNSIVDGQTKITFFEEDIYRDTYNSWVNDFKRDPDKLLSYGITLSKNKDDFTWVGKYAQDMINYVTDKYTGTYLSGGVQKQFKPATLRIHLSTLSWILLSIDKNKFKEVTRPLWVKGLGIAIAQQQASNKNEMTARERDNWITYPEMVREREKYITAWNLTDAQAETAHGGAERSRRKKTNYKKPKLTIEGARNHVYALVLAFNTWYPPMRLDIHRMKFWDEKKEPPQPKDSTPEAYLWQNEPGKWKIVINNDKITHKDKKYDVSRAVFALEDEITGVTDGVKLNAIITKSYLEWNRLWVAPAVKSLDGNMQMGRTSYQKIWKTVFRPGTTQNLVRKAFVNYWYPLVNNESKLKIAERMRHTSEVAQQNYIKSGAQEIQQNWIDANKGTAIIIEQRIPVKLDAKPILDDAPKIEVVQREYFDAKKWAKKYYTDKPEKKAELKAKRDAIYANPEKKQAQLRAKHLYLMNKSAPDTIPRKTTIAKYNFVKGEDGLWM